MKKVTIYGERCSGTNYLEQLLLLNFDVEITWNYGWKHFFGFNDLTNTDDILFIGIVRNLYDWINSLYREKHHLSKELTSDIYTFLTHEFYSFYTTETFELTDNEIMTDRNMETNERYKNIFELRRVKNKFLIQKMPILVKNYCIITHDELLINFKDIMYKLKNCGLEVKKDIDFPLNVTYYKTNKNVEYKKKVNEISKEIIDNLIMKDEELLFYEKILFPKFNIKN